MPHVDDTEAARLGASIGCSRLLARILLARGFDSASARRFLSPCPSPSEAILDDIDVAVRRIERAIADRELIFIHGDYDVDGITSAVILRHTLDLLGARTEVFLPHRIHDGYGVAARAIEKALAGGARLFITADCGVSSADLFGQLRDAGCETIVADHHVQEQAIETAVAVLNPVKPGSCYPDRELAAVGVAYKLALRLLEGRRIDVPAIIHAVAAIGTVADVAPLRGENREIVRRGLMELSHCDCPGLTGMLHKAGIDPRKARARHMAFQVGPRLNAAGRIDDPSKALDLFFERDAEKLRRMIEEIEELNRRRQRIEERISGEALALVRADQHALTLAGEGWERGVIGIVASRLVEKFNRPVLMISRQEDMGYGSARSVPGTNLVDLLRRCSDDLLTYGGHEQAAGFTMRSDRIAAFAERMETLVAAAGAPCVPQIRIDATLSPEEMTFEAAEELTKMEPVGFGNAEPLFVLKGARLIEPPRRMGTGHLRMRIEARGRRIAAVAWRKPEWLGEMQVGPEMDCVVRMQINEHQGVKELRLQIEDFRDGV